MIVSVAFFVGVGVQLMGLGSFRKRWEILLTSRRVFPNLAWESAMPAPATGIMSAFCLKRALKGSSDLNSGLYHLVEVSYAQVNYLLAGVFSSDILKMDHRRPRVCCWQSIIR